MLRFHSTDRCTKTSAKAAAEEAFRHLVDKRAASALEQQKPYGSDHHRAPARRRARQRPQKAAIGPIGHGSLPPRKQARFTQETFGGLRTAPVAYHTRSAGASTTSETSGVPRTTPADAGHRAIQWRREVVHGDTRASLETPGSAPSRPRRRDHGTADAIGLRSSRRRWTLTSAKHRRSSKSTSNKVRYSRRF